MRNLILLLSMMIFTLNVNSQNFVTESKKDVKDYLNDQGYIIEEVEGDDGLDLVLVIEDDNAKVYFFNDNNVCVKYIYINTLISKSEFETILTESYGRKIGDFWYDGDSKIYLEYNSELASWEAVFELI